MKENSSILVEQFNRFIKNHNYRFLDAMEDLVRIRDENGEIVFENESMCEVMKNSLPLDVEEIHSLKLFSDLYNRKEKTKITMEREVKIEGKLYTVKASPIFDDCDNVIGYIEVFRDITLERNVTMQLFKANEKIHEDILLAKNIQRSILPKDNTYQNVSFKSAHIASEDLSGDVFDVVEINSNKIGVYIADVVGHGISASIMTMFIRQSMRRILQENQNFCPRETIMELKRMFTQLDLDISQYFSIIYMLIDTKNNKLSYVNAGHNCMPILFNEDKILFMHNKGKLISNLFLDCDYNRKDIDLNEGDKILLYTDGLTETVNDKGEYFDEKKLFKWVKNNRKSKNIVKKLLDDLTLFRWRNQKDDIAILLLEMKGKIK